MAFNDFTEKQAEYIRNASSRWNFKTGATRSGKTYLDRIYTIPTAIRELRDKEGLSVLLGVTRSTIERNLLKPMRDFWTEKLVGQISSDNTCRLFGEEVYCLGAEKISQQSKLRGASFKYVYGDEVAEWNKEVFDLLKSRLDCAYSRFDGTCNPKGPQHWLKKFIDDKKIGVYNQTYTIFDNPTLSPVVVKSICAEYQGTVDYQRYILGRWVAAEGAVYPIYAENPERYDISPDKIPRLGVVNIGVDFGGNKSATTFVCTGFSPLFREVVGLEASKLKGIVTPDKLDREFCGFVEMCYRKYGRGMTAYCDSAEQTLIAGLKQAAARKALPVNIRNAYKTPINERVRIVNRLLGLSRFRVAKGCEQIKKALCEAVYNPKSWEDERLDDGTSDIDTLDALEYSIEPHGKLLLN